MISKLIFAGYTGSKNQVRTQKKKSSLFRNRFFFEFEIEKKSSDTPYFKNQVEIDRGIESYIGNKEVLMNFLEST